MDGIVTQILFICKYLLILNKLIILIFCSNRTETLSSEECNNETIVHLTFFQRIFKLPDFVSSCEYCQALPNPHIIPKFCQNCYRVSYCDE